jgi:biotin carboxyl carrier protein
MKKYRIKLNSKVYEVEIEEITGGAGESATTTTQERPVKANNPSQSSGGVTIEAPMAGSILSIAVKVGDTVKKDQTLLILEAMKMENEISSPVDGKVLSIGVSKGDSVNAGNLLVQIG